jgi:hypothetical protein
MGYGDNCGSNEGWSLSQSIPNGHVFPSSYRGFWMFTPTKWMGFFINVPNGVGSERHWKPSSLSFARIL